MPRRDYSLGEEASWDGLDPDEVELHQQRLTKEQQPVFPIIDTCRRDNGGILPLNELYYLTDNATHVVENFVTLVLAAGAASRFFRLFDKLVKVLKASDYKAVRAELQRLQKAETLRLPLFYSVRDLIKSGKEVSDDVLDEERDSSLGLFPFPKAFHPCVLEEFSFFAFKIAEHRAIGDFAKQVYVIPERSSRLFKSRASAHEALTNSLFFEQKGDLCTVRLLPEGEPYRDENNCLSVVPAGHGVLTRLFPYLKEHAHSAFIRNIDNVMGGAEQPVEVCRSFLRLHHFILTHIQKIRNALRRTQLTTAEKLASDIIISVLRRKPPANPLWCVLKELFHTERPAADATQDQQNLVNFYARPVNTLGQVPNSGKDMGGTPVFAKWKGRRFKLCLEIPHMRKQDVENIANNPQRATHFNPVFAACELNACYDTHSSPFWLAAQKTFEGQKVMYHETLFSEVVGNSLHCNTLFVEVPRSIFNPHKCITDAKDRRIEDWGFSYRDFPSW